MPPFRRRLTYSDITRRLEAAVKINRRPQKMRETAKGRRHDRIRPPGPLCRREISPRLHSVLTWRTAEALFGVRNALTAKDIDPVEEFGYIHKNDSPPPPSFELRTGPHRKSHD